MNALMEYETVWMVELLINHQCSMFTSSIQWLVTVGMSRNGRGRDNAGIGGVADMGELFG